MELLSNYQSSTTSNHASNTIKSYSKIIAEALSAHLPNSSYSSYLHNSHSRTTVATMISLRPDLTGAIQCTCPTIQYSSLPFLYDDEYDTMCDDKSRLLVILRWIHAYIQILFREYYSKPFLLAFIPLLVGLFFGYWMGRSSSSLVVVDDDENVALNTRRITWKGCYFVIKECLMNTKYLINQPIQFLKNISYNYTNQTINNNNTNNIQEEIFNDNNNDSDENERDDKTRTYLKSEIHTQRESGIPDSDIPKHIAVIMDGNRRYGKAKYGSALRGHWDGSKTLVDFAKWCMAEGIQVLTVYAFSTENWNRSASEISSLMKIFCKYCDELRVEALEKGIQLRVLSTDTDKIPPDVAQGIHRMVEETKHCSKFIMNICLSYGSRHEIVKACRSVVHDVMQQKLKSSDINETTFESKLMTYPYSDPDVVIRTSGEYRISNFLLWQLAYSEMFFLDKPWPELEKEDLLEIIRAFGTCRKRRFGK